MANLSEDIQCASFDTRPPMLDRTDFASWQQHIRLLSGKRDGVEHLESIDERNAFQMEHLGNTCEGNEGGPYILGVTKRHHTLINHYTDAKDIWDNVKMLLEGSELRKEDRESQLFVTAVKLNRGLRDSNYDQLYAYLKQHEAHANENKTMPHSKELHSAQATTKLRILQRKDVVALSSGEWVALDEEQLLFIVGGQDNVVDEDGG
ncbi:hypothetical protein Tco_0405170 [Tanacetum coccineum]